MKSAVEGLPKKQLLKGNKSTRMADSSERSLKSGAAGSEGVIKSKENQSRDDDNDRPKDRSRPKTFPEDGKSQRHSEEGH
jgi:hypothetical protein